VRERSSSDGPTPSLAAAWLREQRAVRPRARTIRFDAIGVLVDARGALRRLEHLEGAW